MKQHRQTAAEYLESLLADVRAGKTVDPLDISAARENVALTALAEEGRAERAAAADAEAKRAAADALAAPLSASLRATAQIVHEARQTAAEALNRLLTANAAFILECQEAGGQLVHAGFPHGQVHVTSVTGVPAVRIAGTDYEFFTNTEELIAILHVLQARHRFSYGVRPSRDLARVIPEPLIGGPQKSINIE